MLKNFNLMCLDKALDLSKPQVMGILNITPNSFSEVGRYLDPDAALNHAYQMVKEGAAIIDVGAEPTNPGLFPCVSLQEELDRLLPIIERLTHELAVPLSVDTSKPEVMQEVVKRGVGMINDVRALREPNALTTVAKLNVPVCLMHMAFPAGKPTPDARMETDDIVLTVKYFLQERIAACEKAGIARDKIVIDPGIGHGNFGKDLPQNLQLLARQHEFQEFGLPILIGVSRKTFIGELLNIPVPERLPASLAAAVVAVSKGANIIRAHDVKATVEAIKVAAAIFDTPVIPRKGR